MTRALGIWSATRAIGAGLLGIALAMGAPGHLPRPLIPLLPALAGAVSGLVPGCPSRLLSYAVDGRIRSRRQSACRRFGFDSRWGDVYYAAVP